MFSQNVRTGTVFRLDALIFSIYLTQTTSRRRVPVHLSANWPTSQIDSRNRQRERKCTVWPAPCFLMTSQRGVGYLNILPDRDQGSKYVEKPDLHKDPLNHLVVWVLFCLVPGSLVSIR